LTNPPGATAPSIRFSPIRCRCASMRWCLAAFYLWQTSLAARVRPLPPWLTWAAQVLLRKNTTRDTIMLSAATAPLRSAYRAYVSDGIHVNHLSLFCWKQ
jgi:hypothetical protein